jgi:hypothetical protein
VAAVATAALNERRPAGAAALCNDGAIFFGAGEGRREGETRWPAAAAAEAERLAIGGELGRNVDGGYQRPSFLFCADTKKREALAECGFL